MSIDSSSNVRTVLALDASDVGDLRHIQESSYSGQKALAKGRVSGDNVGVFALLDVLNEKRSVVLGKTL